MFAGKLGTWRSCIQCIYKSGENSKGGNARTLITRSLCSTSTSAGGVRNLSRRFWGKGTCDSRPAASGDVFELPMNVLHNAGLYHTRNGIESHARFYSPSGRRPSPQDGILSITQTSHSLPWGRTLSTHSASGSLACSR